MAKNKNKPIVELDKPNGKVKAFWNSAKEASEFYKIHQVNISYNVNGKTKQAKGKYFRFATKKEIEIYQHIKEQILPVTTPELNEPYTMPLPTGNDIPVEIIPEKPQLNDNQLGYISPFERMLQESKKKFNDNSE